ncbi:MAG: S-layer homology domain-containing protein [Bryobacteraceae bacterium]
MNRIHRRFGFFAAVVIAASLTPNASAQLTCPVLTNTTRIAAQSSGDVQTVRANAFPCEWGISSSETWIFTERIENQARITVLANPGAAPRTGTISIFPVNIAATLPGVTIPVVQAGAGCGFTVNPQNVNVASTGAVTGTAVNTNGGCTWTTAVSASWLALPPGVDGFNGPGFLSLTAAANGNTFPRVATSSVAGEFTQFLQKGVNTPELFADVSVNHPFFDYITLMRTTGLTSGCTPTTYCPDRTITRAEISVFLVRALYGLADFAYPAAPYFTDVPNTHPFFRYIQKIRQLGITLGCSDTAFCPDDLVTRATGATLVVRARLATSSQFAHPVNPLFTDVPFGDTFFGAIQKAKQLGITSGCTATTYCPTSYLTRGQAAVFIIRGLMTQ